MITLGQVVDSETVKNLLLFGVTEIPVYARVDGVLHQIDTVGRTQIDTSAGAHDIVVLDVSGNTSTEL